MSAFDAPSVGTRRTVRRLDGSEVEVTITSENTWGFGGTTDDGESIIAWADGSEASKTT